MSSSQPTATPEPQTVGEQDSAALWNPQHKRSQADQRGVESIARAVDQLLVTDTLTAAQRADIHDLHSLCTPVETIVRRLRLSEAVVRRVIAEGRDDD